MSELLAAFIQRHGSRRCVFLTGAGCSTESGVPDYRGPNGLYRRPNFKPLTMQDFMKSEFEQKRYWVRSMLGYSSMSGASCNATHMALYELCRVGVVSRLLTQNVDGLHHLAAHGGIGDAAESAYVKYTHSNYGLQELHGNIHQVICTQCAHVTPRQQLQRRLQAANRALYETHALDVTALRPDGDYEAPASVVHQIQLRYCEQCGGRLKPHVVLFGENVPPQRVREALEMVRAASCLVCLGTSLHVFSAYRFVLAAKECGVPVAIVTAGATRADGAEDLKIDTQSTAEIMRGAARLLTGWDVK